MASALLLSGFVLCNFGAQANIPYSKIAVVEAANDWDSWPRDLPPALQQKLPRLIAKIRADIAEIRQIYERAEAQSSADQKPKTQTR